MSRRYPLRAPVIFRWKDPQGTTQQEGGFTRDMSSDGVFVLCSKYPPAGIAVALEVFLPPIEATAQGLRLQAEGTVVRIGVAGEGSGFAAAADFGLRG